MVVMVEDGILRWQSPLAASRFVIHLRGMRRLDHQPTTTIIVNPSMVLYDPPDLIVDGSSVDWISGVCGWWVVGMSSSVVVSSVVRTCSTGSDGSHCQPSVRSSRES